MQKGVEVIDPHFIHGLVDDGLVSREKKFLHGPWGDLIGCGRADAGGGHGVVRLWRTSVIIIGHARSFEGPFNGLNL